MEFDPSKTAHLHQFHPPPVSSVLAWSLTFYEGGKIWQLFIYIDFIESKIWLDSYKFSSKRGCVRTKPYRLPGLVEGDSFRGESIALKSLFDELRETDLLFSHNLKKGDATRPASQMGRV